MKKSYGLLLLFLGLTSLQIQADFSLYNHIGKIENNSATDYDGNGTTVRSNECRAISNPLGLPIEIKPVNDSSKPSFKIEKTETDYKARACSWYEAVRTYKVTSNNGQNSTISLCVRKAKDVELIVKIDKDYTAAISHCYK